MMIAALFEGREPDDLLAQAVSRFRCIPWGVLTTVPEIIVGGGPLDVVGAGRTDLHTLSTPCRIGECDAFVSFSWHDDARLKWDALVDWCATFEKINHRLPSLWLDKVCIDQKDITSDLQCLPIFLAACNLLLVISGTTYTSRLWTCVELFVYVNMHTEGDVREVPIIVTLGADDSEHARVRKTWWTFDLRTCECNNEGDKTRILAVIERHPHGIDGFNTHVEAIAATVIELPRARESHLRSSQATVASWSSWKKSAPSGGSVASALSPSTWLELNVHTKGAAHVGL